MVKIKAVASAAVFRAFSMEMVSRSKFKAFVECAGNIHLPPLSLLMVHLQNVGSLTAFSSRILHWLLGLLMDQKIIQIYDLKTYYVNNIAVMQLCFLPYQPAV